MTHLCYSLDETAQRLDMSETVLVRLSQYFKVPQNAYEETGYLSFKGDLLFSDQDIAFFRQVKEHLLAGENLETVKARMQSHVTPSRSQSVPENGGSFRQMTREMEATPLPEQKLTAPPPELVRSSHKHLPVANAKPRASTPEMLNQAAQPPALTRVDSPELAEQAADENFERYRGKHRPRKNRVFENMMRDVGPQAQDASAGGLQKTLASLPFLKALQPKAVHPQFAETGLEDFILDDPDLDSGDSDVEAFEGPACAESVESQADVVKARHALKKSKSRPLGLAQTREIDYDHAHEYERLQHQAADVAGTLNERFPWKAHVEALRAQPRPLEDRLQKAAKHIREQAIAGGRSAS